MTSGWASIIYNYVMYIRVGGKAIGYCNCLHEIYFESFMVTLYFLSSKTIFSLVPEIDIE